MARLFRKRKEKSEHPSTDQVFFDMFKVNQQEIQERRLEFEQEKDHEGGNSEEKERNYIERVKVELNLGYDFGNNKEIL